MPFGTRWWTGGGRRTSMEDEKRQTSRPRTQQLNLMKCTNQRTFSINARDGAAVWQNDKSSVSLKHPDDSSAASSRHAEIVFDFQRKCAMSELRNQEVISTPWVDSFFILQMSHNAHSWRHTDVGAGKWRWEKGVWLHERDCVVTQRYRAEEPCGGEYSKMLS